MRPNHIFHPFNGCFCLVLCLALLGGGCSESRYVTVRNADDPGGDTFTGVSGAFAACMTHCEENTPLGFLTRQGCFKGCFEARRQVQRGAAFPAASDCYETMDELELNRDLYIEDMQGWCDIEYTHLHKLAGCRDAMRVFYSSLTAESVCGGTETIAPLPATPTAAIAEPLPKGTYTAPPVTASPAGPLPAYVPPSPVAPYPVDTPKYQRGTAARNRTTPSAGTAPAVPAPNVPDKTRTAGAAAAPAVAKDTPMPEPQETASPPRPTPIEAVPAVDDAAGPATPAVQPDGAPKTTPQPAETGSAPAAAPSAQPAPVGALIPPVPSMLNQSYTSPPFADQRPGTAALSPAVTSAPTLDAAQATTPGAAAAP